MRILTLLLAGLMAASWLAGCAWVSQTATLKLEPRTIPSKIGQGRTVAVRVVDRRPARAIGHRGLDSKNAAITTDQNVADLFQQKLHCPSLSLTPLNNLPPTKPDRVFSYLITTWPFPPVVGAARSAVLSS